jgi:hypothetical protein
LDYETWPSTIFTTDTAAAGTTGTAGFLPRLVFVQLSACRGWVRISYFVLRR